MAKNENRNESKGKTSNGSKKDVNKKNESGSSEKKDN